MNNAVMNIGELTRISIEEQALAASKCATRPDKALVNVVREYLTEWETSLFPLLQIQKKSRYRFLAEMLGKAGYGNLTESHLCALVCKVRKERARHV